MKKLLRILLTSAGFLLICNSPAMLVYLFVHLVPVYGYTAWIGAGITVLSLLTLFFFWGIIYASSAGKGLYN